jgi:hypothetical protein
VCVCMAEARVLVTGHAAIGMRCEFV